MVKKLDLEYSGIARHIFCSREQFDAVVEKDYDVLYRVTEDDGEVNLYIGDRKLSNEDEIAEIEKELEGIEEKAEEALDNANDALTSINTINTTLDKVSETADEAKEAADEAKAGLTDGSVTKIGTGDVGSETHPIYIKGGEPTEMSGTLEKEYGGTGTTTGHIETTARTDTTSEDDPGYAGEFTAIDEIETDSYGHITKVNTKTITMPGAAVFAICPPAQIQLIVQSGQAANYWSIGDSTPITLNGTVGIYEFNNDIFYATIIDFDHNPDIEGTNTLHLQMGKRADGVNIAFCDDYYGTNTSNKCFHMNSSNTNSGGWEASYMRQTICEEFFEALPTAWQNIITPCTKYSDNVGGATGSVESNVTATEDKIWLLNVKEVGLSSYANTYEANYTTQYSYYTSSSDRIRYAQYDVYGTETDTAITWWLRSVYASNTYYFCYVTTSGGSRYNNAYNSRGFAPGFKIS